MMFTFQKPSELLSRSWSGEEATATITTVARTCSRQPSAIRRGWRRKTCSGGPAVGDDHSIFWMQLEDGTRKCPMYLSGIVSDCCDFVSRGSGVPKKLMMIGYLMHSLMECWKPSHILAFLLLFTRVACVFEIHSKFRYHMRIYYTLNI